MRHKLEWKFSMIVKMFKNMKVLSFEELLEQDKSVSIHTRSQQMLATEIFKVYRSVSPPIFSELFRRRDICYDLRSNSNFALLNVKSVFQKYFLLRSKNLGHCISGAERVPECLSLSAFKKGIKKWQPKNCPCRLCKQYVLNLGYISNTSETCF